MIRIRTKERHVHVDPRAFGMGKVEFTEMAPDAPGYWERTLPDKLALHLLAVGKETGIFVRSPIEIEGEVEGTDTLGTATIPDRPPIHPGATPSDDEVKAWNVFITYWEPFLKDWKLRGGKIDPAPSSDIPKEPETNSHSDAAGQPGPPLDGPFPDPPDVALAPEKEGTSEATDENGEGDDADEAAGDDAREDAADDAAETKKAAKKARGR